MAKKATKTETTPATPEVKSGPLITGKITATSTIEFKHPYDQNTVFRPSISMEVTFHHETLVDGGGDDLTNEQIMDNLLSQVTSALDRSKRKVKQRLEVEEQLFEARTRMDTLRRQTERPLSKDTKEAYSTELKDLEQRELELLQELETLSAD